MARSDRGRDSRPTVALRPRALGAATMVLLLGSLSTPIVEAKSLDSGGPPTALSVNSQPAATQATQVSAHDGSFWLGSQPIALHGLNLSPGEDRSEDFSKISSWGMTFIRLPIHWSLLEPVPPVRTPRGRWTHTYDTVYLDRYAQTIATAERYGLHVMVDNHGCGCSFFGWPDWLYRSGYNSHGIDYAKTKAGDLRAKTDFWSDDLRQQFAFSMWTYVAERLDGVGGVAGYEVMNEPNRGSLPSDHSTTQLILDWQLDAGTVIRSADPGRVIFFTTRAGYAPGLPNADLSGWVELGNVAFDVHDYFGGRWGTGLVENTESGTYREELQFLFAHVLDEGAPPYIGTTYGHVRFIQNILDSLAPSGIPLVVGEFGVEDDDPGAFTYFGTTTSAFNHLGVSWATMYRGRLGIVNTDYTLKPWAHIVIDAA